MPRFERNLTVLAAGRQYRFRCNPAVGWPPPADMIFADFMNFFCCPASRMIEGEGAGKVRSRRISMLLILKARKRPAA